MIDRRGLLKSSLLGCGAALAGSALGSLLTRSAFAAASAGPVVKTSLGKVRGAASNGVSSFKGIHYGASPEGAGRFLPPHPPKPWGEVADALEYGTMAPQNLSGATGSDIRIAMGDIFGPGGVGEDCLTLNVWTPSIGAASGR